MVEMISAIPSGPNCSVGIKNNQRIKTLEESDTDQWLAINQLRNRPPVWATLLIAILSGVSGVLLGMALSSNPSNIG